MRGCSNPSATFLLPGPMNTTHAFRQQVCPTLYTYPSQRGVKASVVKRRPYTRYVLMKPTVRCCAERLLSSAFITYLRSLLTPHIVVWDGTFANSTWRLSSRSLPFELTMAHGFDELSQTGEQSERITIAFLALAWFFIILRVWTRTWIIASFGWDDATMILAGVCLITV